MDLRDRWQLQLFGCTESLEGRVGSASAEGDQKINTDDGIAVDESDGVSQVKT